MPKSFHFTKYRSFLFMTLLSKISSTIHSSSPSMISGSGGGGETPSGYWVCRCRRKFNDIKNRVEAFHG
jgi:hypothetical protein